MRCFSFNSAPLLTRQATTPHRADAVDRPLILPGGDTIPHIHHDTTHQVGRILARQVVACRRRPHQDTGRAYLVRRLHLRTSRRLLAEVAGLEWLRTKGAVMVKSAAQAGWATPICGVVYGGGVRR